MSQNSSDIETIEIRHESSSSEKRDESSEEENEEEFLDDLELETLIFDKNSNDGCVKYHDIFVRAISKHDNEQLYILIKYDEKNQYSPKM